MPANNSVKRNLELIEKDTSKVLGLKLGSKDVTPGMYVPKAGKFSVRTAPNTRPIVDHPPEAQSPPELYFNVPSPSKTYMLIALDIDAPFPQLGVLGPILHWNQPGLTATPAASGPSKLESSEAFVANYIAPAPPPLGGPHRYCFFLYEQPEGFDGKKYAPPEGKTMGNFQRMWYDLDAFEKEAGLGAPLAVNYFKSN